MMKKTTIFLLQLTVFVLVTGTSLSLAADSPPTASLGIRGGYFEPTDDQLDKQIDDGIGGFNLNYLFTKWLELGIGTMVQSKLISLDTTLRGRVNIVEDQLLVPFAGGGFDMYWVVGDVKVHGYDPNHQSGYHFEGGIQILLDYFDHIQARSIKKKWGVDNTYLSLGYRRAYIDNFQKAKVELGGEIFFGEILVEF